MALLVKNLFANAEDLRDWGLISGWVRSPGEGCGNPLKYSCLENLMHRGAGQAAVQSLKKLDTTEATWHTHVLSHLEHRAFCVSTTIIFKRQTRKVQKSIGKK